MNCRYAQDCMERYLDESITEHELLQFIEHIRECSVCREELEIYYIIEMAQNFLADDQDISYNISQMVERDMNELLEKKQRKRNIKTFLFFIYVMLFGAVILGICILLGYM